MSYQTLRNFFGSKFFARPRPYRRERVQLQLERLEDRVVPSVSTTFVNDNWNLAVDLGAPGLSVGDIVQNSNDTIATNSIVKQYGIDAFGIVTTYDGAPGTPASITGAATITDAVTNTNSGGVVNVLEGTYAEDVNVSKSVTLAGAQHGVDARTRTGAETIVDGTSNGGKTPFHITANDVILDGFTVQGATNGNLFGFGIFINPGVSGTHVVNDIIQNNIAGIALTNTSSADQALIQHNLFQNNTQSGPVGGTDIYADQFSAGVGGVNNALINANTFTNTTAVEDGWALGISNTDATPFTAIAFTNNTVTNHGRGVYFFNTNGATVSGNTITGASHYAIGIFGSPGTPANASINITGNILNEAGSGGAGVELVDDTVTGPAYTGTLTLTGNQYMTSGTDKSIDNESATPVNATGETFNGVAALGDNHGEDYFTIEDTIVDAIDVSGFGLVRLKAGNVYVTPNSFLTPTTTTPSIQRGIDAASIGDTVNVKAGTYTENVVLNKQLTLRGAQFGVDARGRSAAESIITPLVPATHTLELVTGAAGAIIDGFTFSGGTRAIESSSGPLDNLQILNNRILGFTNAGVFLNDAGTDITIDQNVIDGSSKTGAGDLFHLDTDLFNGFYFTNNNVVNGATATGFFVDGNHNVGPSLARTPLISGNLFEANNTGMNLGTRAFGSLLTANAGTISRNTFSNNNFDGLQGGVQHVLITQNTFSGNGRSGLALTSFGNTAVDRGAQNTTISENFFTGNVSEDVLFSSGQAAGTIATNILFDNRLASTTAVTYNGTEIIQASGNYWGAATNPETASKIGGTGAANVDYSPWLDSGTDTNLVTPGFQGGFATLNVDDDSAFSTLPYGTVTPVASQYITEGYDLLAGSPLRLNVLGGVYTENVDLGAGGDKAVTFAPGAGPGQVTVNGNFTLSANDTLQTDLNGPPAGTGFDQLIVSGAVNLGGSTLALNAGAHVPVGTYTFIKNDGSNAVAGTFDGLPEGTLVTTVDGQQFRISYVGGTGNDVTLTTINQLVAASADMGSEPRVNVYNLDGSLHATFLAYAASFTGGVRVAVGDINGDGADDIIVGSGPGQRSRIKIIDGTKLNMVDSNGVISDAALLGVFLAYGPTFTGGVTVAVGDVNGDSQLDLIVGPGEGIKTLVKVIDGNQIDQLTPQDVIPETSLVSKFLAFGPTFKGGVSVAAGNFNGDAFNDIVVGAGVGVKAYVKVIDGQQALASNSNTLIPETSLLGRFIAFGTSYTGGVRVAAGDTDGDGTADVIVSPMSTLRSFVKVVDGTQLGLVDANGVIQSSALLHNFLAYDDDFRGGVNVAARDVNGDDQADILTGAGPGGEGRVKFFDGASADELDSFLAFGPGFSAGVFVAG